MKLYEIAKKKIGKYKNFVDFLHHLTDIGEIIYLTPEQIMQEIGERNKSEIDGGGVIDAKIPYYGKIRDAEIYISHGKGRSKGNKYLVVAVKDAPVYTSMGWFLGKRVFIQKIDTSKKTKWKEKRYDIYTEKPIKGLSVLADLEALYKEAKEANDDNKTPSTKIA